MAMTVLVTGANGFIGRHLCERLAREGMVVRAAVRRTGSAPENTQEMVWDGEQVPAEGMRGVNQIVHLAARVHEMKKAAAGSGGIFRKTNTTLTLRLAEAALENGVQRLVFLSTVKVFGDCLATSAQENAVPQPDDAYGQSKREAEEEMERLFSPQSAASGVVLRLPLVYGPGNKGNMIPLLKAASMGLPLPLAWVKGKRSIIFVGNVCDAIVRVLKDENPSRPPFSLYTVHDAEDLTSGELYSLIFRAFHGWRGLWPLPEAVLRFLGTLGSCVESLTGLSLPVNRQVVSRLLDGFQVPMEAFCSDYSWRPSFNSQQGIEETVAWYRRIHSS